ncbi:filamentous hemagglutinin N-terminal domain-containing protein [Pelobacter seleniigenes]|uniref:filamentous hemagglutinin N-terminal domain-containing protein n=1 Tax=Pelobacter seleniigenes TaxID=407188 RepID=UPI0006896801|nr:filamentous hemagglutinin N-terminal domain-containing protein [Pelobacter seleniigenes]
MSLCALLAIHLLFAVPVFAAPQGGQVTSGSATINQEGTVTNIDQNSGKAIINWQRFGIAPNETVNFNQPNSHAVALNRVVGRESSLIEGALNANGQVFLINSAGVTIANGASINTAGFVASTQDISDADFLNGDYTFSGDSDAAVINLGTITATDGRYVILLGKTVSNQGLITATKGTVVLAGGAQTTLNFNGDSIVSVTVDQGTLDALVENKEAIYADGGNVILTAKAADDLLSAQVNNTGIIQARTIDDLTGSIELYAHGGTTTVDGTLDASAPNGGDGGFIETSGDTVTVADSAVITTLAGDGETGTWLIDPDGFVISNDGGDISATLLGTLLDSNHITLESTQGNGDNADIDVNDAVSWSANTTLTLTATNDININAAISAGGEDAGLDLNYGSDYNIADGGSITLSGASASLTVNGNAYTLIHSMDALAAVDGTGRYAIAEDLDAAGTLYSSALVNTLSGTLTGLGHGISNLTIRGYKYVALVGKADAGSVIRDLHLVNADITGGYYVGTLVGQSYADISHVSASGSITGTWASDSSTGTKYAGGLIGYQRNGSVTNAHADVDVTGHNDTDTDENTASKFIGGLIGYAKNTSIRDSSASGAVTGSNHVGGLLGYLYGSSSERSILSNSYATGIVTGTEWGTSLAPQPSENLGGLIGWAGWSEISDSYASGAVIGGIKMGGLIGKSANNIINNVFASGVVTSSYSGENDTTQGRIGGLIGESTTDAISDSHATGDVSGKNDVGGLIGYAAGTPSSSTTVTNCYASGDVTSNNNNSAANTGGLIGRSEHAIVTSSYATGDVTVASGSNHTGGLIGESSYTDISSSFATGNVIGANGVGGLIGALYYSNISDSYATGNVTGEGGFVGGLAGAAGESTLTNVSASGNVYVNILGLPGSADYVGGLLGSADGSTITNATASGNVTVEGNNSGTIGGLLGNSDNNSISDSTATGSVALNGNNAGRLIGTTIDSEGETTVTNSTYTDVAAEAAWQERQETALDTATTVSSSEEQGAYTMDKVDNWNQETASGSPVASSAAAVEGTIAYVDSANYSSHIRSIEIDGVRYNLEDDKGPSNSDK